MRSVTRKSIAMFRCTSNTGWYRSSSVRSARAGLPGLFFCSFCSPAGFAAVVFSSITGTPVKLKFVCGNSRIYIYVPLKCDLPRIN